MQQGHFRPRLNGDGAPGFRQQPEIVDEINVVLRVRRALRSVRPVKHMGGCGQICRGKERIAVLIVIDNDPVVAVRRIADSQESISAGSGNDSWLAVECKSVLYLADEPEITGQPHVHRYRGTAGVLQDFKIAREVTILRDIDFAGDIQARDSKLRDNNLPSAEFGDRHVLRRGSLARETIRGGT